MDAAQRKPSPHMHRHSMGQHQRPHTPQHKPQENVGWVQRSETHQHIFTGIRQYSMGYGASASTHPTRFGDVKESTPPQRGKRQIITPRSGTQNKKVGRNIVTACGQPFILSCNHMTGLESAARMMITAGSARQAGRGRVAAPFHPPSPPRSAKPRQKAHRKALPNSPYANGSGLKQIGRLKPCGRLFAGAPQGGMVRSTKLAAIT